MPKREPGWRRLDPKALASVRRAKGISARKLSERIGMSNSYISQVERGSYLPPHERVRQIAKELDTTISSISTVDA
jgi:transcriptional regulator with XRE-family HTH domain